MSSRMKWISPAVALVVGLTSLAPSVAQRSRQQFSDVTNVTLVEVPVTVSNKGEALRGLTKDNFEIRDGKKKVDIIDFEIVDLKELEDSAAADVPVAARRHFLAFFDLSFSDPNSIAKAQDAAADLVLSSLHPTDLAAVATYSRTKGPQLVLPFTSDRNQLRFAIETLGLVASERTQRDPLGLLVQEIDNQGSDVQDGGGGGLGGGFADELQAQLRDLANLANRAQQAEAVTSVAESMDGLAAMSAMLSSVEGRKHVLYLSEGFDGELLFGTEDIRAMQNMARAVEEGRTQDVDNDARFGNSDARRVVDRTLELLRQADASIQAVDIGGLVAGGRNRNLDSLRYMASETEGNAYANFNNLGDAMSDMLDQTSVTYLLTFSPTDIEPNGEYREIEVRTKGVPRGAEISHRPGYRAPKPFSQQSGFERQLKVAQALIGGQRGGAVGVNALAAGFAVAGEKAYVPVLIEAPGSDLTRGFEESTVPIEVYGYAIAEDGTVRDYFYRSLGLDKAQAGPAFEQNGMKYWGHFDLEPGTYTVRVLVRNPTSGAFGIDVDTVTVPGDSNTASVATLFPEQMGKWLLVREEQSDQRNVPFPFLAADQPFIPAAMPQVSGKTAIHLASHGLGQGSLSAEAIVLTPDGQTVNGGTVELAKGASAGDGAAILDATFDAKGVPKGEHLLVVTVKNLANGKEARSTVPIMVI